MNGKVYSSDSPAGYTTLSQGKSMYDHKNEQTSIISPYTQRDHAWSRPEFDASDEVVWANESINKHSGNAYNH